MANVLPSKTDSMTMREEAATKVLQDNFRIFQAKKAAEEQKLLKEAREAGEATANSGTNAFEVENALKVSVLDALKLCFQDSKVVSLVILLGLGQIVSVTAFMIIFSLVVDDLTTLDAVAGRAAVVSGSRLGAIFLIALIIAVLVTIKNLVMEGCQSALGSRVRAQMINIIASKPLTWFEAHRVQDIATSLGENVEVIENKLFRAVVSAFWGLVNVITGLVVIGIINTPSMGITLAVVPFLALCTFLEQRFKRKLFDEYSFYAAQSNAELSEFCNRIRPIRAAGMEYKEVDDYILNAQDAESVQTRLGRINSIFGGISTVFGAAILVLLLWFEGHLVEENAMSVGKLITCVAIAAFTVVGFTVLFEQISYVYEGVDEASISLYMLLHQDDGDTVIYGMENAYFMDEAKGEIVFQNVALRNPGNPTQYVLNDLNLTVPAGVSMAVVGQAGCGKSFLVGLIARFYEANTGRVMVDGVDVFQYDMSYQQQVGLVTQEHMMINGSIAYNIMYGTLEDITMDDVIQAAKLADAHTFISRLPQGYDTIIGEGQVTRLAPSQLKRLAISRVFAQNKPIVIMDDPCVDLHHHADVVRTAIRRMQRNPMRRTAVMICHDVEDVKMCDYVTTLANGKVLETGTKEDLEKDPDSAYMRHVSGAVKYKPGRSAMNPSTIRSDGLMKEGFAPDGGIPSKKSSGSVGGSVNRRGSIVRLRTLDPSMKSTNKSMVRRGSVPRNSSRVSNPTFSQERF